MDTSNFVGHCKPSAVSHTEYSPDGPSHQRLRLESNEPGKDATNGTPAKIQLTYGDYTVGWICALPVELAAATKMLDEVHRRLPSKPGDTNTYNVGSIGPHNIVIACLPSGRYGTTDAAVVSNNMDRSFPSINIRLMVGIGGGVPTKVDIRLGDVIVGHQVVQYDFGKIIQGAVFHRSINPVEPPHILMTAIANLRARHESQETKISEFVSDMLRRSPSMRNYGYPSLSQDRLFLSTYEHDELMDDCDYCDQSQLVDRPPRLDRTSVIHYGVVASGNKVIKHGGTRDDLAKRDDALCFEMEAAGLVSHFQCLVIRGICDYCDSHKNKQWQPYAAAVAAAYTKELLSVIDAPRVPAVCSKSTEQSSRPDTQKVSIGQRREYVLKSLEFQQRDARRSTIRKAHSQTCQWILKDEKFLHWINPGHLRQHGGFLWIKGKPGAGKSTLMKFILDKAQKSKDVMETLNFFFNARGNNLEKSTTGMYRSLLLQLFTIFPGLQNILDSLGPTTSDGQIEWTLDSLKDLFEKVLEHLKEVSVACYIDALDECDEDEIRDMISFFERVGQLAIYTGVNFYVCFSSRHYPHISMREGLGLELVLENQVHHRDDIAKYVSSELKIGYSKLAEEIRIELQIKSSGVFMWVVLVVDILNKERDKGRIHTLRERLQDIPADLNDLFRQILTRGYDNEENLLLCFQWILFSIRPLTPNELYFAIISQDGSNPPSPDDISEEDIRIFIVESSKGLAEITKSERPTVQFIHESVKDFLLGGDGLTHVWPDLDTDFKGNSHLRLRDCCFSYLETDIFAHFRLSKPLQWTSVSAVDDFCRRVTNAFPFFGYAVHGVLFHADEAGKSGIKQQNFVSAFPLDRWIEHYNLLETRRAVWYTPDTRFLYILAEANTPHLIEACPDKQACFEERNEPYGCPLLAAIVTESHEALKIFRNTMATYVAGNLTKRQTWYICQEKRKLPKLSRNITFSPQKQTLLSHLVEYGDIELVGLYMQNKKLTLDLNSQPEVRNLLLNAIESGNSEAVRVVIEAVRVFIEFGPVDLQTQDNSGQVVLIYAIAYGNEEIVNILLEAGVSPDLKNEYDRSLLPWASDLIKKTSLRLRHRINPNSMIYLDQSPLSWACSFPHMETRIIQLLLEASANLDLRDDNGRSPLSWACSIPHMDTEIIQLLLEAGANPDLRDNNGRSPLSWACPIMDIETEMIQLLLEAVADPDLQDYDGRSPLSWVCSSMYICTGIIQFLLKAGANPDLRDNNGRSPLSWACSNSEISIKILQLFLKAGADPDTRDNDGRSLLSWACSAPGIGITIIQLLLKAGTDPDTRDNDGRSAL